MRAMQLKEIASLAKNKTPLEMVDIPIPLPQPGELLVKVIACGVCHTELDEIEGRTPPPKLPVVLGHQVVGKVEAIGVGVLNCQVGDRVGIAWIYSACGECEFCRSGDENLCSQFKATGRDVNGGYAEFIAVPENYTYALPTTISDLEAAPLLCAGAIGYRSLKLTGLRNGERLGLSGFGASGHLVLKLAQYQFPHSKIFVFARSEQERAFAMELGAIWAGDSESVSPEKLNAVIDTTPVWKPIPAALENLKPGGRLVINAIRKEDDDREALLKLDWTRHLWMEKEIKSVANVTRWDVTEFLQLVASIPLKPEVQTYPLKDANQALVDLKERRIRGAKVLMV
jgi:alcohol dehydrogenase, propanol-preferring